jgi:large subunit ribosomal protein L13
MKKNDNKNWYLFDASGYRLGRLSTQIAYFLRGKGKIDFANNKDGGDYVVVTNASKILLTGKKEEQKVYYKHTGYLGNLKKTSYFELKGSNPEEIIKKAVYGMLPKNKLRDSFISRLKVYAGESHPHGNAKFVNVGK